MNWRIENTDTLELLRELPANLIQTAVTSPPSWGPHDYGSPASVWNARRGCRHHWQPTTNTRRRAGMACERCDAWRGSLGLEPTPEMYVEHLVTVLREVRRVLRADGTLWLNVRDTPTTASSAAHRPGRARPGMFLQPGTEARDLLGLPWLVALALQADGWHLAEEILSGNHRATSEDMGGRRARAREHLFLLTKQPAYFYNPAAATERVTGRSSDPGLQRPGRLTYADRRGQRGQCERWAGSRVRQRRSWWTTTANSYPRAVWPERLTERCVLAGSAPVACGACGAPYQPDVEGGWRAGCEHNNPTGRCLVLDPFCGAGMSGVVAQRLGRSFLGIESHRASAQLAHSRLTTASRAVR